MSVRLILHIGRHKTGTTAIQEYLRGSKRQLERHRIIYPVTGRERIKGRISPGQHAIAKQCHERFYDAAQFEELKEAFLAEVSGYDTILLSSEGFQNLRDIELLRAFFDDSAGYDVTIICICVSICPISSRAIVR